MKKYFIIAAAAVLALVSCAKFETYTDNKVNDEGHYIGFTNYSPKTLTRAGASYAASTALIAGQKFGVYAYSTTNGNAWKSDLTATGNTAFMTAVPVTYANNNDNGANNTYSPKRYWPTGDNADQLTFWAYYPVTASGTPEAIPATTNGITYTAPDGSNGVGSYAFTAAATAADMVDFMVSDVVNDQFYTTNSGTVPLVFKHQLTKVEFCFKKAAGLDDCTVIELEDVELSGIKNKGTLSTTYAAGATDTDWGSTANGSAGYEVTVNKADPEEGSAIVLTTTATTIDPQDAFLMVPQAMVAATQKITVTWRVKVYDTAAHATANDGTGLLSNTKNTKALSFKTDLNTSDTDDTAAAAIDWQKNHYVKYTLTIGPKPILFTATVTGWNTVENGYINVH